MINFQYTLIRTKRKTIALIIKPDGQVFVRAPLRASEKRIQLFLETKVDWVERHLQTIKTREIEAISWYLWGDEVSEFDFLNQKPEVDLYHYINQRIPFYIHKIGLKNIDYKVSIKTYKSKWGSCKHKKTLFSKSYILSFNQKLLHFPKSVVDYVIAHEVSHILQPNHSRNFWSLVESLDPNFKTHKKILRSEAWRYCRGV